MLLTGKTYTPGGAREIGLLDAVVTDVDEVLPAARAWIRANPEGTQPWDSGAQVPGGTAFDAAVEAMLPTRAAGLRAQHRGSPASAPENILSAAVESTQVDVDTAFVIETRYFVELVIGPISKNIKGTFIDRQTIRSGASRPGGFGTTTANAAAVLGAGMMGAGIALAAAAVGIKVFLKDVDLEWAQRGRAYAEKALNKAVACGRRTAESAAAILDRIVATADVVDLAGVDAVIEAVFEDPDVNAQVFS